MPGKYLRGALIHLTEAFLLPVPNVIVFQYNPESLTHTWTPPDGGTKDQHGQVTEGNPFSAAGYPGESFSFDIAMNSTDTVADGIAAAAAIAKVSGLATRLAALELLQYPITTGKLGALTGGVGLASLTGGAFVKPDESGKRKVPEMVLPPVLFAWGPGRIVPVRLTRLSITETLYDVLLNPTHAEASLELQVLTLTEMNAIEPKALKAIMQGAYAYTHILRQTLATANLVNAADSVIGLVS
jgi:hypothetical protein